MRSSPLLDLPVELVRDIYAALLPDTSRVRIYEDINESNSRVQGLARMSRTCKTLHIVAAPFLTQLRMYDQPALELNFIRYLRDIWSDRRLAARERFFRADFVDLIGPIQDGDFELLDKVARSLNVQQLPSQWLRVGTFDQGWRVDDYEDEPAHPRLSQDWRGAEKARKSELTNLILMGLPKLESLSLTNALDPELRPRCLLSLREADLGPTVYTAPSTHDYTNFCDASDFHNLFRAAPYLERLTITNCNDCSAPLGLRRLKHMTLKFSCLSSYSIQKLLGRCESLESVTYQSCGSGIRVSQILTYEAWPRDFVTVLWNSRNSLRELTLATTEELRIRDTRFYDEIGTELTGTISREELQCFPALQKSSIDDLRYDPTVFPLLGME
ncbi:hypothetical protein F5Y18DRAFT_435241 [Xylariaceae sp. FL1019]|nr:hypothetical protein F5Y18DRAFT_435241 [Xylariaceae sp. FL1019]